MDKQMKDIFCRLVDTELEKISKLPQLNDATLNNLHKLTDIKKNLLKIEMLEGQNGGSSYGRSYGYDYGMSGNSYGMTPMYGNSYDSAHSRMEVSPHLEAAMRDAKTDQEREEIRQLMARYHS